jgi:hypothetical protein
VRLASSTPAASCQRIRPKICSSWSGGSNSRQGGGLGWAAWAVLMHLAGDAINSWSQPEEDYSIDIARAKEDAVFNTKTARKWHIDCMEMRAKKKKKELIN